MNAERLFTLIGSIQPLSEEFKKALESELTLLSLPKNYLLLEAPKVSEHVYFLHKGFAMTYTFVDGEKQIGRFWKTEQLIISVNSFITQKPSNEFIQLALPSDVLCLSYSSLLHLTRAFPESHLVYQALLHQDYTHYDQHIHNLMFLDGAARYKKLLLEFPSIEQLVAQEHIASYIGIAPQSLSRIKRRTP